VNVDLKLSLIFNENFKTNKIHSEWSRNGTMIILRQSFQNQLNTKVLKIKLEKHQKVSNTIENKKSSMLEKIKG